MYAKIVDEIFTSDQKYTVYMQITKNIYHKMPIFGIKMRHDLQGTFSTFELLVLFILYQQR